MQALVLEKTRVLALRDIELAETLGLHDVRVRIHTMGVCGRDVHYCQPGAPVPFDVVAAQVKAARLESIFRHATVMKPTGIKVQIELA
jgi:D-arabinose 1-dehydrogenase-like Zn-dependent alcohol dehydrogenase